MQIQENTNSAIARNTAILYAKLVITAVCGFLTTRFALQALGVVDFGLFSILGSVISFVAILNTIMVSTTNRYIAVALGQGNMEQANKQFNVCLVFHLVIAIITAIVAFPIGSWYIHNALNYEGDIHNAIFIYNVTVAASVFSFFSVPFSGLLCAKENFWIFCLPSIIGSLVKLGVSILIVYFFTYKLFIYASVIALYAIYPPLYYIFYCIKHYKKIIAFKFVRDWSLYKEISAFSGWVAYGAVAYIGKAQGAAVLVNLFFNTVMNTALGVANSINSIVGEISRSTCQTIDPQITKSYASGNKDRTDFLLVLSTKVTFLVMFLISTPFLVDCEWVLSLWLGNVPDYAVIFTILLIIDNLVDSMNAGVKSLIFASGKIMLFQIVPSTLKIISIIIAYIVLKSGFPAYSLILVYIAFSFIVVVANQLILKKTVNFSNSLLFKKSYVPSLIIVLLSLPVFLFDPIQNHFIREVLSMIYVSALVLFVGLSNNERAQIKQYIMKKINHK